MTRGPADSYWSTRLDARFEARSRERARAALRLLEGVPPRSTGARRRVLIDVGCGPGWALEVFRDAGFEVLGADKDEEAVAEARRRGFRAERLDLEADELPGRYDVVVALEVLEHLRDPLAALRKLARARRPGGRLVVSLPNEFHLVRRLAILAGASDLGGHAHPHLRIFDLRRARELFEAAGLRPARRRSTPIAPPRMRTASLLLRPLAQALPGLFALANLFLLEDIEPPRGAAWQDGRRKGRPGEGEA